MTSLFWETISPEMRQVLNGFSTSEIGKSFYLAGGWSILIGQSRKRKYQRPPI